jgi:hypothetical protein
MPSKEFIDKVMVDLLREVETKSGTLSDETVPPCCICKKVWQRKDYEQWVYHVSRGVVCRKHPGVMDWYNETLRKANEKLLADGVISHSLMLDEERKAKP